MLDAIRAEVTILAGFLFIVRVEPKENADIMMFAVPLQNTRLILVSSRKFSLDILPRAAIMMICCTTDTVKKSSLERFINLIVGGGTIDSPDYAALAFVGGPGRAHEVVDTKIIYCKYRNSAKCASPRSISGKCLEGNSYLNFYSWRFGKKIS
jgi:hypothetical protein